MILLYFITDIIKLFSIIINYWLEHLSLFVFLVPCIEATSLYKQQGFTWIDCKCSAKVKTFF